MIDKAKKKPYSFASYIQPDGSVVCDVEELASELAISFGNVPKSINDTKAMEIVLLARAYNKAKRQPPPQTAGTK